MLLGPLVFVIIDRHGRHGTGEPISVKLGIVFDLMEEKRLGLSGNGTHCSIVLDDFGMGDWCEGVEQG